MNYFGVNAEVSKIEVHCGEPLSVHGFDYGLLSTIFLSNPLKNLVVGRTEAEIIAESANTQTAPSVTSLAEHTPFIRQTRARR